MSVQTEYEIAVILLRLSIKHRIHFKILLITYKALNGLVPQYLSELLSHYSPPVRYDLKTLTIW